MWDLAGGVAVVTGAGSGIGRELAKRLARENMSLALADVNETTLQKTVSQIGTAGASTSPTPNRSRNSPPTWSRGTNE